MSRYMHESVIFMTDWILDRLGFSKLWVRIKAYIDSLGPNNIIDGIAPGSIRTIHSKQDCPEYRQGANSFSEGFNTTSQGNNSHSEGYGCEASGMCAHAEGFETASLGFASHSEGEGTVALTKGQTAVGRYNDYDIENKYAFIVGNGTSGVGRRNAFAVGWDGRATLGAGPESKMDAATKEYVDNAIAELKKQFEEMYAEQGKSEGTH